MLFRSGPPVQDVQTPYDPAIGTCLAAETKSKQLLTVAVGKIEDKTDKTLLK